MRLPEVCAMQDLARDRQGMYSMDVMPGAFPVWVFIVALVALVVIRGRPRP